MATKTTFWNRSTLVVITGASRGIGKCLALKIASLVDSNSTFILLARSTANLEETKKQILDVNTKLDVKTCSVDLSKPDPEEFDKLLSYASGKRFELNLLIHNAGSLLTNVPASKLDDVPQLTEYMSLNLFSVTTLTSSFLKLFTEGERTIVNLTSLYGVQPGKGLVHYCVGKASREMYFRVLAAEEPSLNILNYSPGPIDTDMFRDIAHNCWHSDSRISSKKLLDDNKLVKMEDTIQKLVNVLESGNYQRGGRIDFYDRV